MGKIVKLVKKYEGQPNIFEKIRVDMGYETDTLRNNLRGMRCTTAQYGKVINFSEVNFDISFSDKLREYIY